LARRCAAKGLRPFHPRCGTVGRNPLGANQRGVMRTSTSAGRPSFTAATAFW
jgi:hypothetical protein